MPRVLSLTTRRPGRTLLAVLLFALVAGALGAPVAGLLRDSGGFTATDANSARAVDRAEAATGVEPDPGLVVLTPRADAAAHRSTLAHIPGVAAVAVGPPSRDRTTTYLAATFAASASEDDVVEAAERGLGDAPGVVLGGAVLAGDQIGDTVSTDLGRAEMLAFPVLLLLSLVFFRGRAAVLPLAIGLTTVLGTFLVLRGINEIHRLSIFALNLVIGLGLGLAIDYALFLLTRFREEVGCDDDVRRAVAKTFATAGRTVVYSSVTVAISLLTLTLFPLNFLQSMGIAGTVVALMAGAVSLVVAPAVFALWGRKLEVAPRRRGSHGWYRLAHAVMRRPGGVAAATAVLMVAAAAPALRAEWSPVDSSVIPKDKSARTVADRLATDFARPDTDPVTVVLGAPRGDVAGVRAFAEQLTGLPGAAAVATPSRLDERTWQIAVTPEGDAAGEAAQALVEGIRAQDTQYDVYVAGAAAEFVDQQDAISSRLLPAGLVLGAVIFAVLWLMTGSMLLPIKAIVMNVLTACSRSCSRTAASARCSATRPTGASSRRTSSSPRH
jgi:RND superfamily putative drug exporter